MNRYILSLLLSLVAVLSATAQDYSKYTKCAEQDSLALVAFYNATDGPNWTSSQDGFDIASYGGGDDYGIDYYTGTWGTSYPNAGKGKWLVGPVKDWFGVLLEKQQIGTTTDSVWRVIHITPVLGRRTLGNNNMKGYIPKEVGLLTALQWFRINGNIGLTKTEVPDELYLPKLYKLDLENVLLSGAITSGFRRCTNLGYINLRYNYFDTIPTFDFFTSDHFKSMPSNIYLYNTQISYASWEPSVDIIASITSTPSIKYQLQAIHDVGRAQEYVVKPGDAITLHCNDAGKQGTCTWEKKGANTYKTGTSYTISSVTASDTGTYRGILANEYIRGWQVEGNTYNDVYTKPIRVVFVPSVPYCQSYQTSYSGNEVYLKFNKPMATPKTAQASQFTVKSNGSAVSVSSISLTGRLMDTYVLKLSKSLLYGETVSVSYTQGDVTDSNSGVLASFTDVAVQNLVRDGVPQLVSAITRKDGEGIILTFDKFIDPESLVPDDFTITTDDPTQSCVAAVVNPGPLDDNISKSIQLVVASPLDSGVSISVSYKRGSMTALYGAAVQSFSSVTVKNVVIPKRAYVSLHFIDLCKSMKNIYAKGDLKILPIRLTDDGTLADTTAKDGHWTKKLSLAAGTYTWAFYERKILAYDTVRTISATGVETMQLNPTLINDSLVSPIMNTLVSEKILDSGDTILVVTGDSLYSICDKSVTFELNMKSYTKANPSKMMAPYLMGIDDDWATGLEMSCKDKTKADTSVYTYTLTKLNIGDKFVYNFRNGNDWENNSPENRSHTVVGVDTVRVTFGDANTTTAVSSAKQSELSIYPNPATEVLYVSVGNEAPARINIYNLYGQCNSAIRNSSTSININALSPGIYILEAIGNDGAKYRSTFLKK